MSAQQRDSRSRGQMSTTTGSPAAERAAAGLVAVGRLRAVRDDHVARQVAAVLVAGVRHRRADLLRREARAQLADQLRGDGHRGVGGLLRAPDAGQLRLGLRAPAQHERLGVDVERHAAGAQVVGDAERERGRHDRALQPELAARAQRDLELDLVPASRRSASSCVGAQLGGVDHVDPQRAHLVGVEHADGRDPPPARLRVEERVDDPDRDRVEQVGRRVGRAVDQQVTSLVGISSRRASTSGTWRV